MPRALMKGRTPRRVYTSAERSSRGGSHRLSKTTRANSGKEGSGGQQFYKRPAVAILGSRFRQECAPFRMKKLLFGTGGRGGIHDGTQRYSQRSCKVGVEVVDAASQRNRRIGGIDLEIKVDPVPCANV